MASGFGWYSLSAILIGDQLGPLMGGVAFFNDLTRELLAFILIPLVIHRHTALAIGYGGATSMDFTLPVIQQHGGVACVPIAVVSGFILSLLSPPLILFFFRCRVSGNGRSLVRINGIAGDIKTLPPGCPLPMLNGIWLSFFIAAFAASLWQWLVGGDSEVFARLVQSLFDMAKVSVDIILVLLGTMTLWLGFLSIAEKAGLIRLLGRVLDPLFCRLMPEVPAATPLWG